MTALASILGALAAPSATPVRVTPRPRRCDVAAMLTEALRGRGGADAAIAAESKRLARELAWRGVTTHEAIREATRLACVLRDRCAEHAEPATMVLAVIRELLTDAARDGAMELDALARDAARAQGSITAAHEAEAARMVTEVMG